MSAADSHDHHHDDHLHPHDDHDAHAHHDHHHGHQHDHAPGGTSGHGPTKPSLLSNEGRTLIALGVTFIFMLIEIGGGLISGSLALLADAAHMLADVLALGLTWGAFRFGKMMADGRRSYGYRRLEVLAAWINGVTVLGLSVGIVVEAVLRLIHPETIDPLPMMGVAVAGFIANLVTFRVLEHGHDHGSHDHGGHDHGHGGHNINMRGAVLHVLGDLLGSVAAIAAAGVIWWTGWTPIDPILSIALSLLIVFSGIRLVRQATHILLEGSPEGFSEEALRQSLLKDVSGLAAVHHIHAWSVGSGQPMLTLHAVANDGTDRDQLLSSIKAIAGRDFGFAHSVVQVEGEGCNDEGERCV